MIQALAGSWKLQGYTKGQGHESLRVCCTEPIPNKQGWAPVSLLEDGQLSSYCFRDFICLQLLRSSSSSSSLAADVAMPTLATAPPATTTTDYCFCSK